jgi:stage V sporulation protein B
MERQKEKRVHRQSFLHGALILVIAIVIEKIIGAIYKIPLSWVITSLGYGYFQNAYSVYSPMFSIATAGFPIAISRMVSENYYRKRFRDIRQIHRASIRIFLVLGVTALTIMLLAARPYTEFVLRSNAQNALPAIYAIAPAVFFASLMSIYRGYYEGLRNMTPTAISEVIEAVCKLLFGLTAAVIIVNSGLNEYAKSGTVYGIKAANQTYAKIATLPYAAAGAIFGVTLGGLFGFLFLLLYHKKNGDGITPEMLRSSPRPMPMRLTMSRLIRTAIPVALGSLAINLSSFIDSTLLQSRIGDILNTNAAALFGMYRSIIPQEYMSSKAIPSFLFGCFGNATNLFMLVPSITQAFGVSALPSVTEAWTEGDPKRIRRSMESVMRIVTLITIPSGIGLSVFAMPIASLIYPSADQGPAIVGKVLVILGLASIFAATSTPVDSMLQAVGRVDIPVKLVVVGLVVKIITNYTLVGIPEINVLGAGTGTLLCYLITTVMALYSLFRVTKISLNYFGIFFKPFLASVVSIGISWLMYRAASVFISGKIAVCFAMLLSVLLYAVCVLWFHILNKHDISMLPKGQKIVKILEKHNWIR